MIRPSRAIPTGPSRRRFVQGIAVLGGAGAIGFTPRSAHAQDLTHLGGNVFDLTIAQTPVNITGRARMAITVNGMAPGPVLRWREGDTVTLNVANRLGEPTSIHWHGIRSPADMDGVPGLSFRGIMPGETFTYRIPIKQAGTYWYHSHSGMQEQLGLHGAIVIEPNGGEPHSADREHVIVLADWTDEDPMTVVANLKMLGDYYNRGQRTVGDLARELKRDGVAATWREGSMWARMNMTPTDILDVSGATYTYLVNGAPPSANWTALFQPDERVRLRIINASAMTIFDVRIPGLAMSVIQADGRDVRPVTVDQFRIGVAETYDVIVAPKGDRAYTLFAQTQDRSGYARATLAPRMGMAGAVPPMDPRPLRTMTDMGMSGMGMEGMGRGSSMRMGAMPTVAAASTDTRAGLPAANADHVTPKTMKGAVNVDNVAIASENRLGEAGDGLEQDSRRTLVYTDLKALQPGPDPRQPGREIVFHLTGNMQRWTWGFDGRKFAQALPIHLKLGERVRFVLVNDTMMDHPIHLHGLYSEIENGQRDYRPLKHTVTVKPGERMSYLVSADTPGHWAFHCHLLYHMETGMFRTVVVS
ncbi:MAG: copper resistance system multicopper oxidase [Caulobacteraceae bacterium]